VQFPADQRQNDTTRAINAGLRMQRAMENYKDIKIMDAEFAFGMRVGIHVGRFLVADIGTPWRMAHVLLGAPVLSAKRAESKGEVGRVCLTLDAKKRVRDKFRFEAQGDDYSLVVDDLSEEELGDYDIMPSRTRSRNVLLLDASKEGLINAITDSVEKIEPLACFVPSSVLKLSVENVTSRGIPPDFQEATVIFANLLGYPDDLEEVEPEGQAGIVAGFSHVISLINAELEARGGVMQRVTFHHPGPDILGIFGVPDAHSNDTLKAAQAAYAIREIVKEVPEIKIGEEKHKLYCHIGISRGQVFATEVGEREGRREFTVMGNAANMAARLMSRAKENEILVTSNVYKEIKNQYETKKYEKVTIKGIAEPIHLFALASEKK
jgi:adenylate cyclase